MSTKDTVYAWFNDRLATGAIARDTDAYNQAFTALDDLVTRIDTAAPPGAAPTSAPQAVADPVPTSKSGSDKAAPAT